MMAAAKTGEMTSAIKGVARKPMLAPKPPFDIPAIITAGIRKAQVESSNSIHGLSHLRAVRARDIQTVLIKQNEGSTCPVPKSL